ncbi:MAG: MGMT family protein [Bacteroidia bacterium]|nr:MGMT family protein [Bacteroidia bacterium]
MQADRHSKFEYFHAVYEVVKRIPKGRVTTYGAIAQYLGLKSGARMVGYALTTLNRRPFHGVPAHRVVNRNGLLTGKMHFGSPTRMAELLADDGVEVSDDRVKNFSDLFWDPARHLPPFDFGQEANL